jgi:hypothetical protein
MKKIVKLIIWLGLLGLLSFGIWTCFFKKKTTKPVIKDDKEIKPPSKTKPALIVTKNDSSETKISVGGSVWIISQEFIDSIFADHPYYSVSDYNDNGVFDAERWCNRTGKLKQLANFRAEYPTEISNALNYVHNRVPEKAFTALVAVESGGNPNAKNPHSSASGLGQHIKSTAKAMGIDDVFDPQQSLNGTAKYLAILLDAFGGDLDKALLGYEYGEQGAKDKLASGFNPTDEEYVQKIKYLYTHS